MDLGVCASGTGVCGAAAYEYGPMTIFVDQIVEKKHGYSLLDVGQYGYVSKRTLIERAKALGATKKATRLPGKKRPLETQYFFKNARALARIALEQRQQLNDEVVAILFRDSDGTSSAGRGFWDDKRKSMMAGFGAEQFSHGVPMIPRPKSEAWIICALRENPYHACGNLEERSGNDNSPNSLKGELAEILGENPTREALNRLATDRTIDVLRIDMPSLRAFRDRLAEVI